MNPSYLPRPSQQTLPWLLLAVLLAVIAWAYWPGLGGGFIFDDIANIAENPALRVTRLDLDDWTVAALSSESGLLKRPLSMLSFAANHYFWGMDPGRMKLVNLAIHCANTVLLFILVRQLLALSGLRPARPDWLPALAIAAAWALHPINFMAVLYVVQRMESLAQVFVLLGLLLYVNGRCEPRAGPRWLKLLAGLVGCTALGALCKESAVLLPAYAACLELTAFRARFPGTLNLRATWLLFGAILVLPAAIGLSRIVPLALSAGAYVNRPFTMWERLLTEPRVLLDYARSIVLPDLSRLSLFNDDYVVSRGLMSPPATALAILLLGSLAVVAWRLRRQQPLVALGIMWFFVAHALTATFIPLELVFEHRNYFASIGVLLAMAGIALAFDGRRLRSALAAAAMAYVALLGTLTHLRAFEWSDPFRFAASEAAKHPSSPRATYVYASQMIMRTGMDPNSPNVAPTWRAVEQALAAPGANALAEQAALIFAARIRVPQQEAWWRGMQHKLRSQPLGVENRAALVALTNCAVESVCDLDRRQMVATFAAALSRGPDAGVLSIYGKYALWVLHDAPLAHRLWRESVDRGPRNPQFRINLAFVSIGLGYFDEAQIQIDALRKLGLPGQYEGQADTLQVRLAKARAARAARAPVAEPPP